MSPARSALRTLYPLLLFVMVAVLGLGLSGDASAPGSSAAMAAPTPSPALQAQAKGHYAQALAAYYSGEYGRAEAFFRNLTGLIPPHLADDLRFWQAECAFRLDRKAEARAGFGEFLRRAPKSHRAALARDRLSLMGFQGG